MFYQAFPLAPVFGPLLMLVGWWEKQIFKADPRDLFQLQRRLGTRAHGSFPDHVDRRLGDAYLVGECLLRDFVRLHVFVDCPWSSSGHSYTP